MAPQIVANKNGIINVNTNNVTVGCYVTTYGGFGSTYSEFFIQDAEGYGIQVFLGGAGSTNTPPVGTYVTVSGPIEIYHTELEIAPATIAGIVTTNPAPVIPFGPKLVNASFADLATNGLGTNAILAGGSLITFTNVYLYGNKTGGFITNYNKGYFPSNSTAGSIYFTIGQYSVPDNTNIMECFQYSYNYTSNGVNSAAQNPFNNQPIPTNCYQLTGVYLTFGGSPEIVPSRLADYVTTPPPTFTNSIASSKAGPAMSWPVQAGSTYTVHSTTNLLGPWTPAATGLGYYPTNGAFTDTNLAPAKFYLISSP